MIPSSVFQRFEEFIASEGVENIGALGPTATGDADFITEMGEVAGGVGVGIDHKMKSYISLCYQENFQTFNVNR